MGLLGSGKTYLAERLEPLIGAAWYNADKVRKMANDWDLLGGLLDKLQGLDIHREDK